MPPRSRRVSPDPSKILPAVQGTASALTLSPEDAAAVRLAEGYARSIDDAEDTADALDRLGPKLLAVLAALGATPQARAAVLKGGAPSGPNRLDVLRARRSS